MEEVTFSCILSVSYRFVTGFARGAATLRELACRDLIKPDHSGEKSRSYRKRDQFRAREQWTVLRAPLRHKFIGASTDRSKRRCDLKRGTSRNAISRFFYLPSLRSQTYFYNQYLSPCIYGRTKRDDNATIPRLLRLAMRLDRSRTC